MSNSLLPVDIANKVGALYEAMEVAYDVVAQELSFSCADCPDNCCDSYFQHHTYTEWAYLWEGLMLLSEEERGEIVKRAADYDLKAKEAIARDERPQEMCPLCADGLCTAYKHRLLICRLHGVPASMTRPDGQLFKFPGCFRCQEITGDTEDVVRMDRTRFFQEFIQLEMEWLGVKRQILPKVKLTIAEMILKGAPDFSYCK
ncbi:MAG: hypothetical protein PF442_04385 [Desulfobulbaceae bacterium]|jgi:hypothetical protein|nr:hypothetical protein [Desulfobulbaceae bacterium]